MMVQILEASGMQQKPIIDTDKFYQLMRSMAAEASREKQVPS